MIMERLQTGEPAALEQLLAEHPDCADELRSILPTMLLLNDLAYQPAENPLPSGEDSERGAGSAPPAAGVLGDFRIIREIGRGGMGIVYEAEQISLSRRVALKVLPFAAVLDPRHLQRFKNEALAAAHLAHPNIVDVYGVGCERSIHFYAMRLIEGQTLATVIEALKSAPAPPVGQAANLRNEPL
jgi:serine/threonine protein kinase